MIDAPHLIRKNKAGGDTEVDGAVQPVGEPLVFQKAKQVKIPLVGVGQAVEEDHDQREFMQPEQDRLPDFS